MDFSYNLGSSRFYQRQAGWDLDLHVHEKQIMNMQSARDIVESRLGIEVAFMTESFVNTMIAVEY